MPFGIIRRTGPGMRQVVGFGDWSMGRNTFGDKFGARRCNQWDLTFAATRPSSQITLCRLVQFSHGVLHPLLTGDLSLVKICMGCFSCPFESFVFGLRAPKKTKNLKLFLKPSFFQRCVILQFRCDPMCGRSLCRRAVCFYHDRFTPTGSVDACKR